jgi:hypothetical protein
MESGLCGIVRAFYLLWLYLSLFNEVQEDVNFKVNIPQNTDTFLSKPKRQGLTGHYFHYCLTARI